MRIHGLLVILLIALVGCNSSPQFSRTSHDAHLRHEESKISTSNCVDLYSKQQDDVHNTINADVIRLLSWNVKKGESNSWQSELEHFAAGKHIVLMQEALDMMQHQAFFRHSGYWAFAEGYESSIGKTGVANFSSIRPIGECELQAYEPWLGTPKVSMITRYAITGHKESLVVINSHMINFTLGITDYERQLAGIVNAIRNHAGPLIISGDFNTWNEPRLAHLYAAMLALEMIPVSYEEDNRSRFFGLPVDHIFVRGFSVLDAKAHLTESSDHNPITLKLSLLGTKE